MNGPTNNGGVVGHGLERPLGAITTQDHHAVTTAFLTKFYGTSVGADVRDPMPTVTAGGMHLAEVRALLRKHAGGAEPLVRVHGQEYQIADIGMRMLQPRELFRAQGFPDSYVIDLEYQGKALTKTQQIGLAGNSVPPPMARAIVSANLTPQKAAAA